MTEEGFEPQPVGSDPPDDSPPTTRDQTTRTESTAAEPTRQTVRLYRSNDDRVVAGVAGGLGAYFNVDPVVFRILFVVGTFVGFVGPILYLAGWIAIPTARPGLPASAPPATRMGHVRNKGLVIAALIVAFAVLADELSGFWVLMLLALGGLFLASTNGFVLSVSRDRDDSPPDGSTTTSPGSEPIASTPIWSSRTEPVEPTVPPPTARQLRRRGPSITRLVISLLALAAGGLVLADRADLILEMQVDVVLAAALMVVSVALIFGWRFGRVRGLIPVGLVLTVCLAFTSLFDVPFSAGVGERNIRPLSAGEVQPAYELFAGDLVLDLRDIEPGEAIDVNVRLGVGNLTIYVANAPTIVHTDIGLGDLHLPDGRMPSGYQIAETWTNVSAGFDRDQPMIIIRASADVGEVDVNYFPVSPPEELNGLTEPIEEDSRQTSRPTAELRSRQ